MTTTYGSLTALDPTLVTTHSQALTGLTANAFYHYRVRSQDISGSLSISTDFTFATYQNCPCSIWSNAATPAIASQVDPRAVELGVKFRSDVSGFITGIRFYKGRANTGIHVGSLWSSTGTLLATATFVNETASGWQQVNFAHPVAITADTVYIASYHTNVGGYAIDQGYFATSGVDNAPLHALAEGASPNGVYVYSANSAFPINSFNSSNYWVDVVFSTATVGEGPRGRP